MVFEWLSSGQSIVFSSGQITPRQLVVDSEMIQEKRKYKLMCVADVSVEGK